jgi:hypothetical protein
MKELLAALAAFSKNPNAIGNQLFDTFHAIGKMDWKELNGAAGAIHVLKQEAWNTAYAAKGNAALQDPTFLRLESCFAPVIVRFGVLIADAPVEKRKMLIESVSGPDAFISTMTRDRWLATIPTA